jgi:hypothetical protein
MIPVGKCYIVMVGSSKDAPGCVNPAVGLRVAALLALLASIDLTNGLTGRTVVSITGAGLTAGTISGLNSFSGT